MLILPLCYQFNAATSLLSQGTLDNLHIWRVPVKMLRKYSLMISKEISFPFGCWHWANTLLLQRKVYKNVNIWHIRTASKWFNQIVLVGMENVEPCWWFKDNYWNVSWPSEILFGWSESFKIIKPVIPRHKNVHILVIVLLLAFQKNWYVPVPLVYKFKERDFVTNPKNIMHKTGSSGMNSSGTFFLSDCV
jgi:hypothetical protein